MFRQLRDRLIKWVFNTFYKEYVKINILYAELSSTNQILQKDLETVKETLKQTKDKLKGFLMM